MPSKYDEYWDTHIDEIVDLVIDARDNGLSDTYDCSELEDIGNRMSWYGFAVIRKGKVKSARRSHAISLSKRFVKTQASTNDDNIYRFLFKDNFTLQVYRTNWRSRKLVPDKEAENKKESSSLSDAQTAVLEEIVPQFCEFFGNREDKQFYVSDLAMWVEANVPFVAPFAGDRGMIAYSKRHPNQQAINLQDACYHLSKPASFWIMDSRSRKIIDPLEKLDDLDTLLYKVKPDWRSRISGALNPFPSSSRETTETRWSDEQLAAAIESYRLMLELERRGVPYTKSDFNSKLRENELRGRSKKSVEMRFMNISSVLDKMGIDYITGYKPLSHVGENVLSRITDIIANSENWQSLFREPTSNIEKVNKRARFIQRPKAGSTPKGNTKPKKTQSTSTSYDRDPNVVRHVKNIAAGKCEMCLDVGPFIGKSGEPFLTLHHDVPLSADGPDTVCNAVAVCPNCHESFHHAKDSAEKTIRLYQQVERLRKPNIRKDGE